MCFCFTKTTKKVLPKVFFFLMRTLFPVIEKNKEARGKHNFVIVHVCWYGYCHVMASCCNVYGGSLWIQVRACDAHLYFFPDLSITSLLWRSLKYSLDKMPFFLERLKSSSPANAFERPVIRDSLVGTSEQANTCQLSEGQKFFPLSQLSIEYTPRQWQSGLWAWHFSPLVANQYTFEGKANR